MTDGCNRYSKFRLVFICIVSSKWCPILFTNSEIIFYYIAIILCRLEVLIVN